MVHRDARFYRYKENCMALRDNKFCGKISTTFELNDGNLSGPI